MAGNDRETENLKGAIKLSIEAIKALILVNGAAAVGILTFYGNVIKHGADIDIDKVGMTSALAVYSAGVSAGVLSFVFAYMAQLSGADADRQGEFAKKEHLFRIISIGLALGAAGCFSLGSLDAGAAFT